MTALLGPSGSGKTTLLRCIAGLETPDSGEISIGGAIVFSGETGVAVAPDRRGIGMIFQSYALWPHMTVLGNVLYPLRRRRRNGHGRAQSLEKAREVLDLVGCAHLADRYPHQLSGGQQQRVSLARALVYDPAVILFDEPLSNVDETLRTRLRQEIKELQQRLGFTGVYVTHDREEAFYVADQVAVVMDGQALQVASPTDIYEKPATKEVAAFVGVTNRIAGVVEQVDGRTVLRSWDVGDVEIAVRGRSDVRVGSRYLLLTRPDELSLSRAAASRISLGEGRAAVIDTADLGTHFVCGLELGSGARWTARLPRSSELPAVGETVYLDLGAAAQHLYQDDEG
jgi:iron(III) transport system ATP-binding protein